MTFQGPYSKVQPNALQGAAAPNLDDVTHSMWTLQGLIGEQQLSDQQMKAGRDAVERVCRGADIESQLKLLSLLVSAADPSFLAVFMSNLEHVSPEVVTEIWNNPDLLLIRSARPKGKHANVLSLDDFSSDLETLELLTAVIMHEKTAPEVTVQRIKHLCVHDWKSHEMREAQAEINIQLLDGLCSMQHNPLLHDSAKPDLVPASSWVRLPFEYQRALFLLELQEKAYN